jgi:Nuclease-related domain
VRRAGTYAEERFRHGLASWRRRSVPSLARRLTFLNLAFLALLVWPGGTVGACAVSAIAGASIVAFLFMWDHAPAAVLNWSRGAEGERMTEAALAPLLDEGWKALHDVQLRRGNIDHLLHGPAGTFLLETKFPRGHASIEHGMFVTCPIDDPQGAMRLDLRPQLRRRCSELSQGRVPGVKAIRRIQPVVVIWGSFEQRMVRATGSPMYMVTRLPTGFDRG